MNYLRFVLEPQRWRTEERHGFNGVPHLAGQVTGAAIKHQAKERNLPTAFSSLSATIFIT